MICSEANNILFIAQDSAAPCTVLESAVDDPQPMSRMPSTEGRRKSINPLIRGSSVTGPPAALIADCGHSCFGFERIYT